MKQPTFHGRVLLPLSVFADARAGDPLAMERSLWVSVHQQHLLPGLRQPDAQVRAGGCLANAAFLIGDGDDLRVQ